MGRKISRELAFKLVFEHLFNKDAVLNDSIASIEENLEKIDLDFSQKIVDGVFSVYDDLSKIIENCLIDYKFDRIYKVDLAILLVAVYELKFLNETASVVVNEAIEIAKKYSTDKSPKFINGVLATVLKDGN